LLGIERFHQALQDVLARLEDGPVDTLVEQLAPLVVQQEGVVKMAMGANNNE
jgi:hypothetical protein